MKALLDTHTFIWWDSDPSRLSAKALTVLHDPASIILLSVVSVWEILVKSQLGKLTLRMPLDQIIAQQVTNRVQILPATLEHVLALGELPAIHKDPFDRLLISQARVEGATLLSADQVFNQYPVQILW
jgi:PIN domain nuclease of toxin-antitoxin system